jgi:cytosine/adenosine deaminase-related metal-dependent hydrolase
MAGLELGALYPFDEERGTAQLAAAVGFCEEWSGAGDGRVSCMLGPQGTDMLPEGLLKRCWAEAEAHGWMIHLHLAQGDREINQMIKRCAPPAAAAACLPASQLQLQGQGQVSYRCYVPGVSLPVCLSCWLLSVLLDNI